MAVMPLQEQVFPFLQNNLKCSQSNLYRTVGVSNCRVSNCHVSKCRYPISCSCAIFDYLMIMDFEKAALNSFEQVWPDTFLKCCFFHLTQNIWRKVQSEGLQSDYNQDEELAIRIRMLPALAFAAPHEVPHLFEDVVQQLPTPQATGLILYFEKTYIGRTLPGGTYQEALFPIEMWNHHFDTPFGLPRTTNIVEAWHRSFNATVGCHHPTIWKFVASLKREQGLVEVRQAKFIAGAQPPKRVKHKQTN